MAKKRVLLLRRNYLSPEELTALTTNFPGHEFEFIRTDPVDHIQHDAQCRELGVDIVFLPREKPIPDTAMRRGVKHLVLLPNGELKRLAQINPVFEAI